MTQEEKIKLAREWYNDPSTTKEEKSLLEKLFPDLSIPEDERIRKEIIKYIEIQQRIIKDEGHIQQANDIEKWLVWLKKQGEQKPVSNFNKHIQAGDKIVTNENDERVNLSQLNRVAKPRGWISWPEKQDEMKSDINDDILLRFAFYQYDDNTLYLSSVFVEECNRRRGYGSKILKAAEKVAKTFGISKIRLKVETNSWMEEWYKRNGYEYLTSEGKYHWLEKQCEQTPTPIVNDWIEDYWQHHKVNNHDSYDSGDEIQFDHDGFVRFCNTYCKKPEWSDEDEKKFKGVISTITISRGSCEEDDDVRDLFDDEISWLESIKERMKGV